MKILLCLAFAFALFATIPVPTEARNHGSARGERRIGSRVKNIVPHPLQKLKDRRGSRGCG